MSSCASDRDRMPSRLIGIGNALGFFLISFGIFLGLICQNVFSYSEMVSYWRVFILYPGVVSIFRLAAFPYVMPKETPEYILDNDADPTKCRAELIQSYSVIYTLESATDLAEQRIVERSSTSYKRVILGYRDMFKPRYRKSLAACCLLAYIYQFCGINYFSVYSTAMFDSMAGIGKQVSLATGSTLLLVSMISPLFTIYTGRKILSLLPASLTEWASCSSSLA